MGCSPHNSFPLVRQAGDEGRPTRESPSREGRNFRYCLNPWRKRNVLACVYAGRESGDLLASGPPMSTAYAGYRR